MQTPVVNSQQAGIAAASADMNSYAAACQFLLNPPMVQAFAHASAQSLTGAAVSAITWAQPARDNDGTWQSSAANQFTLNTQGFYEVAAHVGVAQAATTAECFLQVTTGADNPNGSGIITSYWHTSATIFAGSLFIGTAGIIPVPLYPLDVLQFMVQPTNTCTTGQFGSTGYWGDWSHRLVSL